MASDNWELPKPIFRSTDGTNAGNAQPEVHSQFVEPDTLSPDMDENLSSLYLPPEHSQSAEMPSAIAVEIEDQPQISEQLAADSIVPVLPENAKPIKKQGSSFAGILLVLFIVLAALVAALYYVFFIRQPADTTF